MNKTIIIQDPPKKVLWKFTLKASSVDEAKKILQEIYPEIDIEKNFVYGSEYKEPTQLKLFK